MYSDATVFFDNYVRNGVVEKNKPRLNRSGKCIARLVASFLKSPIRHVFLSVLACRNGAICYLVYVIQLYSYCLFKSIWTFFWFSSEMESIRFCSSWKIHFSRAIRLICYILDMLPLLCCFYLPFINNLRIIKLEVILSRTSDKILYYRTVFNDMLIHKMTTKRQF